MQSRILFVRAINVGGTAIVPMGEFRGILESLGAADVATYIQSGNAVLKVPGDPNAFHRSVEEAMESRYGWFREVTSRTPQELGGALAAHPFDIADERFSYISFLCAEPSGAGISAAATVPTGQDLWALIGSELHLRYINGAGRATLNHEALTRKLGVSSTARNLRTVAKLIAMSG